MEFRNLLDIKSMFFPMELPPGVEISGDTVDVDGSGGGGEVPKGTGVDVDGDTGAQVATDVDAEKPVGETPPDTPGAEADAVSYEYNGETYTAEQMEQALDAQANKAKWEGDLHQKASDLNEVARSLEASRRNFNHPPEPSEAPAFEMPTGQQLKDLILDEPDKAVEALTNLVSNVASAQIGSATDARTVQDHFNSAHPDYNQIVVSPEFASYLGTLPKTNDGQPIYGNANAFLSYQLSKARGEVEEAKKQGFLEGEKATEKNMLAASGIRLIKGDGAGHQPAQKPDIKSMSDEEVLNAATVAVLQKRQNNGG